jgi:hypothetical protein
MRGNMDPLAPTTHTLGPAISHIAETATSLSSSMQGLQAQAKPEGLGITVRVESDDAEEQAKAEKQEQISKILAQWNGVAGVKELREECEDIMREEDDESD